MSLTSIFSIIGFILMIYDYLILGRIFLGLANGFFGNYYLRSLEEYSIDNVFFFTMIKRFMLRIIPFRILLIVPTVYVIDGQYIYYTYYGGIFFALLALFNIFKRIKHDTPKHALFMGNEKVAQRAVSYLVDADERI